MTRAGRLLVVWLLLGSLPAMAYPWMIRHGQTGCAACHVDPSGGGLLTTYGRAQAQLLLPPRSAEPAREEEGVERSGFFFGLLKLADGFNLGVSFRGGGLFNKAPNARATVNPIIMVTDLRAGVDVGPFQAMATIGYAPRGALLAAITAGARDNIVSREHWLGLSSEDESIRVRVGRMTLPFGLRIPEHTAWVRQATRTDLNEQHQHGVSVAYAGEQLRAELMAILGNFQLRPAVYRERGFSGYFEWAPLHTLAVGVSTLLTHAFYDLTTRQPSLVRQAHGAFLRWAPTPPVVLMAEGDVLLSAPLGEPLALGGTGIVQADWEIVQGVHLVGTTELLRQSERTHYGGWISTSYFWLPQLELRADLMLRNMESTGGRLNIFTLFAQVHLSL